MVRETYILGKTINVRFLLNLFKYAKKSMHMYLVSI